jgi:hypothetical protein
MIDINELDIEKIVSKINVKRIEQMWKTFIINKNKENSPIVDKDIDNILSLHVMEIVTNWQAIDIFDPIWNKLFDVINDAGCFEPIKKHLKKLI